MNILNANDQRIFHDILGDITGFKGAVELKLNEGGATIEVTGSGFILKEDIDYKKCFHDDRYEMLNMIRTHGGIEDGHSSPFLQYCISVAQKLYSKHTDMIKTKKIIDFDNRNGVERAIGRADDHSNKNSD